MAILIKTRKYALALKIILVLSITLTYVIIGLTSSKYQGKFKNVQITGKIFT